MAEARHWDAYWAQGDLSSLPFAFRSGYQGAVATTLAAALTGLGADDRLLDLGTGNGAAAVTIRRLGREMGCPVAVDATDAADIAPLSHLRAAGIPPDLLDGIRFHGNMPSERLDFPNASFSAVTGTYALEYGDHARTLAEVARVLCPAGRAVFILHHSGSAILASAAQTLSHIDHVEAAGGILDSLAAMMDLARAHLAGRPADMGTVQQTVAALTTASRAVEDLARRSHGAPVPAAALACVHDCTVRDRADPAAGLAHVDRLRTLLKTHRLRLDDLRRVALDDSGFTRIQDDATAAGLLVERAETLVHDGALVGWALVLTKPAA